MTGDELRNKIKSAGFSLKEIATTLGMSPQNLNSRLNVKSVRQDFLLRVMKVIESEAPAIQNNVLGDNNINGNINIGRDSGKIALLEARIRALEELLKEKERTIRILLKRDGDNYS